MGSIFPTALTQPDEYILCEAEPTVVVDRPQHWYSYCVLPQPRGVRYTHLVDWWVDLLPVRFLPVRFLPDGDGEFDDELPSPRWRF